MIGRLKSRIALKLDHVRYAPKLEVERTAGLVTLGSDHGGWTFEPSPDLNGSTIVSAGLGEDASFDVEFAARFGATVILVDPTPRAIAHHESMLARAEQPATRPYAKGGRQPAEAYDMSGLSAASLVLERAALWTERTTLKFFAPANPAHVSHSIVNFQNDYARDTAHIEVPAMTMRDLMDRHGLDTLPLMKLDIEGAEIEVIPHMLREGIRPRQILTEYDEMNVPSERSRANVRSVDRQLREAGYRCRHFDGRTNYLYIL